MAGELNLHTTSGLTIKAIVWGENRTTRWNGTAMVATSTIADAAWATGMIACAEQLTSDTTGTGTYAGTFPAGITAAGEYAVEFYSGASPSPGDQAIGVQTVYWGGTVIASVAKMDVYHADIRLTKDRATGKDKYTIRWFKNGQRLTSGIGTPRITVQSSLDGSDLVTTSAMTQIGTTGGYEYVDEVNQTTAGVPVEAIVTATINSASRSFSRVLTRDSTA